MATRTRQAAAVVRSSTRRPEIRRASDAEAAELAARTTGRGTEAWLTAQRDGCVLVEAVQGVVTAAARLDLGACPRAEIIATTSGRVPAASPRLLTALEQCAALFGILDLEVATEAGVATHRSLRRRQTRFGRKVQSIHATLGIPPDYGALHRLELQPEAGALDSVGLDVFGREQFLAPPAATAWRRMVHAAVEGGVEIQPVSAFRSVDYQRELLARKLQAGQQMAHILKVSAAPGYSEHHSGTAIDVTARGFPALEADFEASEAFHWLKRRACDFGFRLSYPRNNRHGIAYEPWHWRYVC